MNKNMMKQAQQLQSKLAKMQEDLDNTLVEGTSGGGAVKVTITGKLNVKAVEILPESVEDVEMLQDLIMVATNDALDKAQKLAQTSLGEITGGMKIPGLM